MSGSGFFAGGVWHSYIELPYLPLSPPPPSAGPAAAAGLGLCLIGAPVAQSAAGRAPAPGRRLAWSASLSGPPGNSAVGRALAELSAHGHDDGPKKGARAAVLAGLRNAGSATELGQLVTRISVSKYGSSQYRTAQRSYERVCLLRGEAPEPLTAMKVVALLTHYVADRGCQSSGLSPLLSRLAGWRLAHGRNWLGHNDLEFVRSQARTLQQLFPYVVTPAEAITWKELDQALAWLARSPGLWALQLRAMMLLAHDGMLRGSEFCDGHLIVKDLIFVDGSPADGRGGIDLQLFWRKMSRQRHDKRDCSTMIVRRSANELRDTVATVQRFIEAAGLGASPESPLFQERDRVSGAVVAPTGYAYKAFSATVRAVFGEAGVPSAELFTGRGLRAGGTTDLYREIQDFQLIGLLGGWKSPKAQALYLRAHRLSFSFLSELIGN